MSVMITNELYEPWGGAVGREGAVWGHVQGHVPSAPRDRMQPPEDGAGGKTMEAGGASPHCGESVGSKVLSDS